MAIETAIRYLIEQFTVDKLEARMIQFLERLDFRQGVIFLKELGHLDEKLSDELNGFYDKRNWYSHLRFSAIIGEGGEEEVDVRDEEGQIIGKEKIRDNQILATAIVQERAREHALEALQFVEAAFDRMFALREGSRDACGSELVADISCIRMGRVE